MLPFGCLSAVTSPIRSWVYIRTDLPPECSFQTAADPPASSSGASSLQASGPVPLHAVPQHLPLLFFPLPRCRSGSLPLLPGSQSSSWLLLPTHRSDLPDGKARAVPCAIRNPKEADLLFRDTDVSRVLPSGCKGSAPSSAGVLPHSQQTGSPILL